MRKEIFSPKNLKKIFNKIVAEKHNDGTIEKQIYDVVSQNFVLNNENDKIIICIIAYIGAINLVYLNKKEIVNIIKEQEKFYNGDKSKFFRKMIDIFTALGEINVETLQLLYKPIMEIEIQLSSFLIYILNSNNINIYNFKSKTRFEAKIRKISSEKCLDINETYKINSKVINNIYFSEKIALLKILFNEKKFKLHELEFLMSAQKINQLIKVKYGSKSNKDVMAFNEIIDVLMQVKQIRNSISHNDLIMINRKYISDLLVSLLRIEDFLRNQKCKKAGKSINDLIIEKISKFKKNETLRGLYKKILKEYKENE